VSTANPKISYRLFTGGVAEAAFRSIALKMHRIG
jgi:hypothetical protein